jgi:hypothetical protein
VTQHQQLGILGQIRPGQRRQRAEQAPHQAVGEQQQHLEMVSATLLIPAAKPQLTTQDRVSEQDTFGYFRHSWTLRVDLVCDLV